MARPARNCAQHNAIRVDSPHADAKQLVRPLDQSAAGLRVREARRRAGSTRPEEDSTCEKPFARCCESRPCCALALPAAALAQAPITLHGAVQFNDGHAFTRALEKFQELTVKYYGKPINFVLHKNSELGLEKDYFAYMNQGISVDYAIVSPGAHVDVLARRRRSSTRRSCSATSITGTRCSTPTC